MNKYYSLSSTTQVLAFAILSVFAVSCAPRKDPGALIAMEVSPVQAYFVPGKGANCMDLAQYKKATESDPTSVLSTSVSENRLLYTNFKLQWKSDNALYLSLLKVTIEHPEIDSGTFTTTIDGTELEALLALPQGVLPASAKPGEGRVVEINSSSSKDKPKDSAYAPCGLHIGGVPFKKDHASSFVATVQFEMVGYTVDGDGSQSPVRKKARARAEFF